MARRGQVHGPVRRWGKSDVVGNAAGGVAGAATPCVASRASCSCHVRHPTVPDSPLSSALVSAGSVVVASDMAFSQKRTGRPLEPARAQLAS